MEDVTVNEHEVQNFVARTIHSSSFSRHVWQILFACSLFMIWGAIFCVFLEGKSSYDLAFTLWNDQYAKISYDDKGYIILPQFVEYTVFLIITAILVAMLVNSRFFRQITAGIILGTGILLVAFIVAFGIVTANYLGGRQGPTGWMIVENPWISLLLFCAANAVGMIGAWFLIQQEIPRISANFSGIQIAKKWPAVILAWTMRILIFIGFLLGSIALSAWLILAFNNVDAALVIAAAGCAGAMALMFFKADLFKTDFKKMKQLGKKQIWLFTPDTILNKDGIGLNRAFDFIVNPRNIIWRSIRNVCNGVFTALCLFLSVAMAFIAIPDEWVFTRFFDLLPWMILGALIGTGAMILVPEPAIYYPAMMAHVIQTYNGFLANFTVTFDPGFIALNGGVLGFWIAVLITSQFYMHRAKTRGRNFSLTIFLMLAFSLAWIALCVTYLFHNDGSSWNEAITPVLNIVFPTVLMVTEYFLYITIGFWGFDIIYRVYRVYKPAASVPRSSPEPLQASNPKKSRQQLLALRINMSDRRKKAIALLVMGIFIGSFSLVQVTSVYGSELRPLLYRNNDFGIWTVDAVTKVESDFVTQMPASAPIQSDIQVAAARGEWNAFHVLVSSQPGRAITLTDVVWGTFMHESSGDTINASAMNVYLVSYLLDRQPDQLLVLPPSVTRSGGKNLDLYFQILVPGNATAGIFDNVIHLAIDGTDCQVLLHLQVYNFTIPANNHLRTAFGGGWDTPQWYDELNYLRISQQDYKTIPFNNGTQYWWNSTKKAFEFNWTQYDAGFKAQLARNFTGIRQGYDLDDRYRPNGINDSQWANVKAIFVHNVSTHLASMTWVDQTGTNHSWCEIPYYYYTDEPSMSEYPQIKEVYDQYHNNSDSKLRTILTLGFDVNYDILNKSVDILCPVIGNFEPAEVDKPHAAGQEYWFYTDVAPIAPYPNFQLQEPGNDPRLLPYICAGFHADGFLYWSMTSGNETYRAGFDGNGDGQLAYNDTRTGRLLPSLRLLSFSLGVEDYECIWLMHATIQNPGKTGPIPTALLARAAAMDVRLNDLVGARPQFVNHDPAVLRDFKADLSRLLEDLWPYSEKLYS